jgi:molybdopterin-containing oxidoreductase family iron-sulfur binding subunit
MRERFAGSGAGLRIVSGALHSPTLARQRDALLARYPEARWHVHEPAMGRPADRVYDLSRAAVIVSLDADLLGMSPGHLRHAREFAARRIDIARMTRLYAIEPTPSLTGRNADHAWAASARDIVAIARALAAAVGATARAASDLDAASRHRVEAIAADLKAHRGASLVAVGPYQPAEVHALADAINRTLDNEGVTVRSATPVLSTTGDLAALLDDMRGGRVDTLLSLDANPAYTLPGFAEAAARVRHTMHLGKYRDETASCSRWHLPALHPLESWSDLRALDGSVTIVQPVLAPLVDGRSAHDVVELLLGGLTDDPRGLVRTTWSALLAEEDAWTKALRDGAFRDTRPATPVAPVPAAAAPAPDKDHGSEGDEDLDIVFRPDEWSWDGRHAENAWLQELPRPVTSLTWGNAALVSPALAKRRALGDGDVMKIDVAGRSIEVPVLVVPGQADGTVTLTLGHGRRGGLGGGVGHDAYPLRGGDETWRIAGATLTPLHRQEPLATTQRHQKMEGRDIVRVGTPASPPDYPAPSKPASFYGEKAPGEYRWGMSIDLAACIGCNACTAACQAENNIPVVGRKEVLRGRQMHWIRVDRYHEGTPASPRTYHQPVPCMHCEHAPCEVVCPVEATVHDSEGLNLQVYNRCIGTRFCSNNCPYKVRRFNFLQYADFASESLKAMRNPDVSVRPRGVMEKCTYCVQRIERAHIDADRDGRRIADGEVRTACQVACPTQAIVFGDLADADSEVAAIQRSPRRYLLLEELGTRPRTSYLASLRNPNPAWEDA